MLAVEAVDDIVPAHADARQFAPSGRFRADRYPCLPSARCARDIRDLRFKIAECLAAMGVLRTIVEEFMNSFARLSAEGRVEMRGDGLLAN